ncbi:MAG: cytochrome c biogenesis CcdA family protein [Chloroflexota bacterium]|jgi:cytochrome c-type biogenesis protein|nr:cytochrome c biogenesis protein CcdA [Chloroflexota bacterium]NCA14714.1 cytochrome c biogenesis protein CcdA [Pseudomonadota bacterium]
MSSDLSLVVAFGAGVLSFVSPCVLPLVPAYVGMLAGATVSGGRASPARTMLHAMTFVIGFGAVFVGLGASVGLVGFAFQDVVRSLAFRIVAGGALVVLGLHGAGIVRIPALMRDVRVRFNPAGKLGVAPSFLVGAAFAAGWTPCIGPILGTILLYAGTEGTVGKGALLLAAYSLGLGVPFLLAGYALESATLVMRRVNQQARAVELASGALMAAMGVVVMTGGLTWFAGYLSDLGVQGI